MQVILLFSMYVSLSITPLSMAKGIYNWVIINDRLSETCFSAALFLLISFLLIYINVILPRILNQVPIKRGIENE